MLDEGELRVICLGFSDQPRISKDCEGLRGRRFVYLAKLAVLERWLKGEEERGVAVEVSNCQGHLRSVI